MFVCEKWDSTTVLRLILQTFVTSSRLWMSVSSALTKDPAPEIDYTRKRESKQGDCARLVLRSAFTDRRCCRRQRRRRRSRSPIDEQSLLNGRAAAAGAGAGRPGRWWWWPPLVQQGSVVHGRRGMLHVALELLQAHGLADVERR